MTLSKGDKAPDFNLYSTEKNEVQLADYKGKNLVILFFPLAFTGVCTAELCTIRDNYSEYETLNAEVIGISVDSLFTLEQFKKAENYNFTLLSDFNKEASRSYGTIYDQFVLGMKGVSKRSAFVVDKTGIIRHVEVLEDAGQLPSFDAIKEALSKLN
jgi:peroxiredoxin